MAAHLGKHMPVLSCTVLMLPALMYLYSMRHSCTFQCEELVIMHLYRMTHSCTFIGNMDILSRHFHVSA
eukprot:scaffold126711_cov22-Tisochrysis_lutea.AAC.1